MRSLSFKLIWIPIVTVLTTILVIIYVTFLERRDNRQILCSSTHGQYDPIPSLTGEHTLNLHDPIPNIVHYLWLLQDQDIFELKFNHFVAIYSAYYYFAPDRIYIHTDVSPEVLDRVGVSGGEWTRRILQIPNIKIKHVVAPTETSTGKKITMFEHRSDFLRPGILDEFGGIYMDLDVIPIRDMKALRYSGFANIVGQQTDGLVNNGCMLARMGSTMMKIFDHVQHEEFDGGWLTHSVELMTSLANRLSYIPGEVLILQSNALAPTNWESGSVRELFEPYKETAPTLNGSDVTISTIPLSVSEALVWWKNRTVGEKWERDFSSSYVIHAFKGFEGWSSNITLPYILKRQSNYARAVFPAIWHAITSRDLIYIHEGDD